MTPVERRRRHPLIRSAALALAAFYALALAVYGAVAIPVTTGVRSADCARQFVGSVPVRQCSPLDAVNFHIGLRLGSLAAGVVVALVLAGALRSRGAPVRAT